MKYENWKSSYDKWKEIVERTREKGEWDNIYGWEDLEVVSGCGYCDEYFDDEDDKEECRDCSLYKENYCGQDRNETVFWQYVIEMRKDSPDWDEALYLVKQMLKRIEQDKPEGEKK